MTPSIFTIFGITGDLANIKIIPSLWTLFTQGELPAKLSIIGFARRDVSPQELRDLVEASVKKHSTAGDINSNSVQINSLDLERFCALFSYNKGNFDDENAFHLLAKRITETENMWGTCTNKLFYLAVPPSVYEDIFIHLGAAKLNRACGGDDGWSRLLIEKPFGFDLQSAQRLQGILSEYFKDEQIYRIDHYLFKDALQHISEQIARTGFSGEWNNSMIKRIDIKLLEKLGVEDRGSFYDSVGTLRDVGQNHMFSMLSTVTMDMHGDILNTLIPWSYENVRMHTKRSQYRGYKQIKGVAPDSQTETYFSLKTGLSSAKWSGVEIYMEAGKHMPMSQKEMVVTLKNDKVLVFRLDPADGYSKVIHSAIAGEQMSFVSFAQIEASWRFVDAILEVWKTGVVPLTEYEQSAELVNIKN